MRLYLHMLDSYLVQYLFWLRINLLTVQLSAGVVKEGKQSENLVYTYIYVSVAELLA